MAGILSKLGDMWKVMRGQAVAYPSKRAGKGFTYVFPGWRDPKWELADTTFEGYVKDGYERNAVIYAALMYKVKALSSVRLAAYIGDPEKPDPAPPDHALSKLVARPNRHQSFLEMQSVSTVYFNLAGNSYQVLDREMSGTLPTAILPMRPDRMWPIPGNKGLEGYVYVPEGKSPYDPFPALADDVMHVKFPNPGDAYEGMGVGLSPIKSLARSGDVDNAITDFLDGWVKNGMMLAGALKTDLDLEDAEIARIKARFRELYGGSEHWMQDIAVLDGGTSYEQMSPTFKEMEFGTIDNRNESRILGPLGVPPILIGSKFGLERSTFSNYEEARRAFWQDTMYPELMWFEAEYNHYLRTEDGGFVRFDLSRVKALQDNIKDQSEAAKNFWQMGVPANMALSLAGVRAEEVPGGDMPRPMGQQVGPGDGSKEVPPLNPPQAWGGGVDGEVIETQLEERSTDSHAGLSLRGLPSGKVSPPTPSNGQPRRAVPTGDVKDAGVLEVGEDVEIETTEADRRRIWEKQDGIAVDHEGAFQDGAVDRFEDEKREVLVIIHEQGEKARRMKQGPIQWEEAYDDLKEIYDAAGALWQDVFAPLIEGVYNDVGGFWELELGIAFDVRNLRGEEWFEDYLLVFSDPITTTSRDTLHDILAQGQAEGWSIQQMQDAIEKTFDQWMQGNLSAEDYDFVTNRLPPFRAELIARTETTRAVSAGTYQIGVEWGAKRKEWLATSDDRTRDSHKEADGQVAWLDDPFIVNGYEMMYPGDTSRGAPVGEIANCRCTPLLLME